jgi:ATP-dependent helicase HrpB
LIELPIDRHVDAIVRDVRKARATVVTAAPGAGKTTRVPPALVEDGPVILLQPRRVAARAIAARIADERGWTLGREVGWQVRFDRRFSPETRLLVVTEGILTARLQADPLLSDFRTIVLDEFHERSIHADVAIALARQAWLARATGADLRDLRIVVMSATLDAAAVSRFLDGCPVVEVPGRLHPIQITYTPNETIGDAVASTLTATNGSVLCFLPGAAEIRRAMNEIQQRTANVEIVPLHGSLPADEQDRALRPSAVRRVIVATNIAETSLTVPGVTAVVDTGLQKVARYDAHRGIDSLEIERITADAADQRAGRAGREAPGLVRRLWDARDRLRPHREPDVLRVDLSGPVLDIVAWGGDPRALDWFERPADEALVAAERLLERLGVLANGRLTGVGEQVRRLPLHPRLGRMLVEAHGAVDVARACALLSERHLLPPRTASTTSDLLSALDDWPRMPRPVQSAADAIVAVLGARARAGGEERFRRAMFVGYPDRVAQRRAAGSPELLLASGTGATLARESGVRDGELLVALDVSNRIVRIASRIEREWLQPTASEVVHRIAGDSGRVKAVRIDRYEAITLSERPAAVDEAVAAEMLAAAWLERGVDETNGTLLRRLAFAGHQIDLPSIARDAASGARTFADVDLSRVLPPATLRDLDRDAPEKLTLPSGRSVPIEYGDDGSVSASAKLQELFGLAESPRIGRRRVPVRFSLLAPNGRPVQVTQDLRSFWERTYPEVRKELRGRYPKHRWPEKP